MLSKLTFDIAFECLYFLVSILDRYLDCIFAKCIDWKKMFENFDLQSYLIRLFVLFLSVSVHEWAHAYTAYKQGDDTSMHLGRVTLNPMKHFEPFGLMLILLRAPIAWGKPVPVNPNRFRRDLNRKNAMLKVSLAGISMNLLLAFVSVALYYVLELIVIFTAIMPGTVVFNVLMVISRILLSLFSANVGLAVFNLLPVPPLDGFELINRFLPEPWSYWMQDNERNIGMVFMLFIVFFNNQFGAFLSTIIYPVMLVLEWPWAKLAELILSSFL